MSRGQRPVTRSTFAPSHLWVDPADGALGRIAIVEFLQQCGADSKQRFIEEHISAVSRFGLISNAANMYNHARLDHGSAHIGQPLREIRAALLHCAVTSFHPDPQHFDAAAQRTKSAAREALTIIRSSAVDAGAYGEPVEIAIERLLRIIDGADLQAPAAERLTMMSAGRGRRKACLPTGDALVGFLFHRREPARKIVQGQLQQFLEAFRDNTRQDMLCGEELARMFEQHLLYGSYSGAQPSASAQPRIRAANARDLFQELQAVLIDPSLTRLGQLYPQAAPEQHLAARISASKSSHTMLEYDAVMPYLRSSEAALHMLGEAEGRARFERRFWQLPLDDINDLSARAEAIAQLQQVVLSAANPGKKVGTAPIIMPVTPELFESIVKQCSADVSLRARELHADGVSTDCLTACVATRVDSASAARRVILATSSWAWRRGEPCPDTPMEQRRKNTAAVTRRMATTWGVAAIPPAQAYRSTISSVLHAVAGAKEAPQKILHATGSCPHDKVTWIAMPQQRETAHIAELVCQRCLMGRIAFAPLSRFPVTHPLRVASGVSQERLELRAQALERAGISFATGSADEIAEQARRANPQRIDSRRARAGGRRLRA